MRDYKFCPMCADALTIRHVDGLDRQVCDKCNWINYKNPLPVIACLVMNEKKEVLLIKRAIEPKKGHWALPGGFIELGESLEAAGERELFEETGVKSSPGELIGVHLQQSPIYEYVIVTGFEFFAENGEIVPGDDAEDAKYFSADNMPELPFSSHRELVEKFFEKKKGEG